MSFNDSIRRRVSKGEGLVINLANDYNNSLAFLSLL